jgi:hypothetical protein
MRGNKGNQVKPGLMHGQIEYTESGSYRCKACKSEFGNRKEARTHWMNQHYLS